MSPSSIGGFHMRFLSLFFCCFALLAKGNTHAAYCGMAGPLTETAVRVALYGGVVPSYFSHKSNNLYLSSDGLGGILDSESSFNFLEQWHPPWTIGLDVGYVSAQYCELFIGASYVKSNGKEHHFEVNDFKSKIRFKSYSDVGVWAGLRYYMTGADLCDGCYFDPFFGAKLGIKFYNKTKADYTAKNLGFFQEDMVYYQKEAVPALGIQLGFTFNYFDCVDVVVMGEAIWAAPLRNNNKIFFGNDAGDIQAISVGETGCIWSFPITAGLVINL